MILRLDQKIVDALSELCKEENVVWVEYSYGRRFGFKVSDSWKEKYSDLKLNILFGFISRCYIFDKDIKNKLGLNENYINLIRRSYYYFDDYDNIIHLEHKRPFGNSYVIGDVLDEFNISQFDKDGELIEQDWEEEYSELLENVIEKIKDFFINCKFSTDIEGMITDSYGDYVKPTKGYIRRFNINIINKNI